MYIQTKEFKEKIFARHYISYYERTETKNTQTPQKTVYLNVKFVPKTFYDSKLNVT